MRRSMLAVALLLLTLAAWRLDAPAARAAPEDAVLTHSISATLEPASHRIEVVDEFRLPADLAGFTRHEGGGVEFRLHAKLQAVALEGSAWSVAPLDADGGPGDEGSGETGEPLRVRRWLLLPAGGLGEPVRLRLTGTIHHPLQMESEEYARSFSRTPGTISDEGVFLGGSSWWLPRFGDELVKFTLNVSLPAGWDAVSQGARVGARDVEGRHEVVWACTHPMDEVYLIAGRFHEYQRSAGNVEAQAFLRSADENLANKYLEVTAQYIDMYRRLIGPYPFRKFALVENFWETGYGMPSFTLLGPQVIRFPFILHSSYPHEILHNWWGNSVYVDWQTGNWCEGLTAYLADHLIREGQGRGEEYRQDTLKAYRDYVKGAQDFPLTQFRSRHSSATQAVGYGKCLMLFHMLRRELGDPLFARGLQTLYRDNLWRRASFADVRKAFEAVAGHDLGAFFEQWVERTGAPQLSARAVYAEQGRFVVELKQVQEGPAYRMHVPVAVTLAGRDDVEWIDAVMDGDTKLVTGEYDTPVLRVDVDPQFDVFRRLDRAEIPPTLSQMFGAERVTLVLPPAGTPDAGAWRGFAQLWAGSGPGVEAVECAALQDLPADRAVWVLGQANPWRKAVEAAIEPHGAGVRGDTFDFGAEGVPGANHSFVYVVRHPRNEDLAVGWLGGTVPAAFPGLARKLPHYGKYSYLAFQGEAPDNVVKGRWSTLGSPLSLVLAAGDEPPAMARLPAREPLARLAPVFEPQRLLAHVAWLADPAREGRGVGTAGLDASADYVAAKLKAAGLQPGGDDGGWFQTFTAEGGPDGKTVTLRNVVGVLPGTNPAWQEQSVVLGAHYDHLGRGWPDSRAGTQGEIFNGADDNASGVAVLLELAELLGKTLKPGRAIVFVAFTGEEWGLKGSQHYVQAMRRWPAARALAMVNMDTVGRLHGGKIQVLGAGTAGEWRHIAMGVGFTTGVESECIADDPGGSDQQSFVKAGVPAVQVFSGANADYHRPTDDVEKIDVEGLVKVATFVREALVYLGERPEPLTSTLRPGEAPKAPPKQGEGRRVSFGTMPVFGFPGPGVQVGEVVEGSPAAEAGIEKGDVLLSIDGTELTDLRAFAGVLRTHAPGDVVKVTLKRGDEEKTLEVTLAAR